MDEKKKVRLQATLLEIIIAVVWILLWTVGPVFLFSPHGVVMTTVTVVVGFIVGCVIGFVILWAIGLSSDQATNPDYPYE
jgi:RsiW-degrading membrane proteinase PrsW (M82 family)